MNKPKKKAISNVDRSETQRLKALIKNPKEVIPRGELADLCGIMPQAIDNFRKSGAIAPVEVIGGEPGMVYFMAQKTIRNILEKSPTARRTLEEKLGLNAVESFCEVIPYSPVMGTFEDLPKDLTLKELMERLNGTTSHQEAKRIREIIKIKKEEAELKAIQESTVDVKDEEQLWVALGSVIKKGIFSTIPRLSVALVGMTNPRIIQETLEEELTSALTRLDIPVHFDQASPYDGDDVEDDHEE